MLLPKKARKERTLEQGRAQKKLLLQSTNLWQRHQDNDGRLVSSTNGVRRADIT